MVSVLRPVDAPDPVRGVPLVVFAGNVGDERTLADVVDRVRGAGPGGCPMTSVTGQW